MTSIEQIDVCINWCKANGAHVDDRIVFKATRSAGITAIASSSIATEKPLISIPKTLLITNDLAKREFGLSESDVCQGNPNALVQLFTAKLKFASEVKSFYAPYIDLLPLKLDQPYFWSIEEISLLKGTDLHLMIKQNLLKMVSEWLTLVDTLKLTPDDLDFYNQVKSSQDADILSLISDGKLNITEKTSWASFPAYVWATSIFNSRAFPQLIIDGNISNINEAFLYPIVDLLNHRNDTKVRWTFEDDSVEFISLQRLKDGEEVFNSYGDKSNEELLLNYGFVQENNTYDYTRLSLRLDEDTLRDSPKFGIDLKKHTVGGNCVQYKLSNKEPLPDELIAFFGYLCKLKPETRLTVRGILEGQDQLYSILMQKTEFFKKNAKVDLSKIKFTSSRVLQNIKEYFNSERKIYNRSLEALQKAQKQIMKKHTTSMTSFKTIYKSDKEFANTLLVAFGITKFEDLTSRGCMKEALLLWIVRTSNKNSYPRKLSYQPPAYIFDCFQDVSKSIVIEKADVMEFMSFYKKLFPNLSERIPETFAVGDWKIRQFIVADTVMDTLVWTRKLTDEPYFIMREAY